MFTQKQAPLTVAVIVASIGLISVFQNCSKASVSVSNLPSNKIQSLPAVEVCNGISCSLAPLTDKPAVTTILLTLGDESNNQLVIDGASSQLLAESIIRYSSPKENPKILVVRDFNDNGEDPEDTQYVVNRLLARYRVTVFQEPSRGLQAQDLQGYDLIWFNNPGAPMGLRSTLQTLLAFPGAVVIQGDDLTRGLNFSLESLTGLTYIDNGSQVRCNGRDYPHDNNTGEQFRVQVDPAAISGANGSVLKFRYGNDIDNSFVSKPGVQVLATATGGPAECAETRPAIVRYDKL